MVIMMLMMIMMMLLTMMLMIKMLNDCFLSSMFTLARSFGLFVRPCTRQALHTLKTSTDRYILKKFTFFGESGFFFKNLSRIVSWKKLVGLTLHIQNLNTKLRCSSTVSRQILKILLPPLAVLIAVITDPADMKISFN